MSEAADILASQIEEWESKVRAARETVRIGESILPHLREALGNEMYGSGGSEPEPDLGSSLRAAAEEQPRPPQGKEEPSPYQIKKADDVQAAVAAILDDLPERFEQSDVHDGLEELELEVNRSTLRQNLILMAKAEEGFRVARPGKGRTPTIFEKLLAS